MADSLAKWAAAIGCSTTPELVSNKGGVKTVIYRSKNHAPTLTAQYIEGQGHGWPGGESMLPEKLVGPNNPKFKATDAIWAFFSKHKKPQVIHAKSLVYVTLILFQGLLSFGTDARRDAPAA